MATFEKFVFFPPPLPRDPCGLLLAGTSYCGGDYAIERQNPTFSVLECITKGRGTVCVLGESRVVEAGDVYLLLPGMAHRYASSAEDPWVKTWFNISGPLVPAMAEMYGLSGIFHFPRRPLGALFQRGLGLAQRNPARAGGPLTRLFLEIIQNLSHHEQAGPRDPLMEDLKLFMLGRWRETLTLSLLSAQVGLSRPQTVRRFRAAFSISPYGWLTAYRLGQAQLLLKNSFLSIREVARQVGFEDEYHFAALFKRHVGVAPGKWRRVGGEWTPAP